MSDQPPAEHLKAQGRALIRDAALVARVILLTTVGSVVTVSICLNLLANLAPV